MSASDAAESIRSGETVFVSGGALTPLEIGNAMGDLVGQRTGIRVMTICRWPRQGCTPRRRGQTPFPWRLSL